VKIINEQVNAIQSFHAWTSVVTSESILYLATNSKFYFAYISGVANGLEVGTIRNLTSPPQKTPFIWVPPPFKFFPFSAPFLPFSWPSSSNAFLFLFEFVYA